MSPWSCAPRIGGYELLGVLGRGSTGVVFEARPAGDATPSAPQPAVALKLVRAGCQDSYENEQRALTALAGRADASRLIDSGTCPGGFYLVTELAAGRSLEQWLQLGGAPPPDLVVELAGRLLAVVRSVHAAGWVHGDVKPANVLLGAGRRPVLIDFGAASAQRLAPSGWRRRPYSGGGPVTGTTAHLAPEVLTGARPTAAGDLYGAGSILWTLLAGSPPFGAGVGMADHALAQLILDRPSPDPSHLTAPATIRDLVGGLLDKRPERRGMAVARYGNR